MIRMYCYSTYKYSPVGFVIGYVDLPINSQSKFTELKKCQDRFVKYCFETGFVRNVYGKEPKKGHYCFMVKKLRCEFINEDNMPSHKICNFFFDFDDADEYKCFVRNYDKSQMESAMNDFIVPDSFAEFFALKLDTESLNKYIAYVLSGNGDNSKYVECDNLCFDTSSSEPQVCQDLSKFLGCPVYQVKPDKFSTKKNFLKPTLQKEFGVLAILGGISLIAVLAWIIVKNLGRP